MNLPYLSLILRTLPFVPILYFQGKKVRKQIPELPEASGNEGVVSNKNTPPFRLLILGESTMAGIGVETHEEGFSGSLAREMADRIERTIQWKVYAQSGLRAKEVTTEIVPKIQDSHADMIVIGLGGNDAFQLNTPYGWINDIQGLIHALRAKFSKASIVFANMPPVHIFPAFTPLMQKSIGGLVEILGWELKELVDEQDNIFYHSKKITIDYWANKYQLERDLTHYFSDGVHPSKLTYQVWAKDFAEFIFKEVLFQVK